MRDAGARRLEQVGLGARAVIEVDEQQIGVEDADRLVALERIPSGEARPAGVDVFGAERLVDVEAHACAIAQLLRLAHELVARTLHAEQAGACPGQPVAERVAGKAVGNALEAGLERHVESVDALDRVAGEERDHAPDAGRLDSLGSRCEVAQGAAGVGEARRAVHQHLDAGEQRAEVLVLVGDAAQDRLVDEPEELVFREVLGGGAAEEAPGDVRVRVDEAGVAHAAPGVDGAPGVAIRGQRSLAHEGDVAPADSDVAGCEDAPPGVHRDHVSIRYDEIEPLHGHPRTSLDRRERSLPYCRLNVDKTRYAAIALVPAGG